MLSYAQIVWEISNSKLVVRRFGARNTLHRSSIRLHHRGNVPVLPLPGMLYKAPSGSLFVTIWHLSLTIP